jgi:hypothetical protein
VPELQRRGRYWDDYDEGTTLRERLYGPGNSRVRDDHPAARYRRKLEQRARQRDADQRDAEQRDADQRDADQRDAEQRGTERGDGGQGNAGPRDEVLA